MMRDGMEALEITEAKDGGLGLPELWSGVQRVV